MPLYGNKIMNPMDQASQAMGQAAGSFGSMMKDIPANRDPGPSAGGAIGAAAGGVQLASAMGASMSPAVGASMMAGPAGLAVGAGVGLLSYLFS